MSELKETIRQDMKTAMKEKDKQRLGAIRMLLAAIQTEETNGAKHELSDEDIIKIVAREIKKRRESADIYKSNGREELAEQELAEVAVFESYQPAQLDDEGVKAIVDDAIASVAEDTGSEVGMAQMGQVMKVATAAAAGQVDGKRLSTAVRERLQG